MYFFFNLSLLFVLLFLFILHVENNRNSKSNKLLFVWYFIVSLFICFAFAYPISDNRLIDLRDIPIIVGSLYVGLGPLLSIFTIIIRGIYGFDSGFWITAALYGGLALLFSFLSPWFLKQLPKKRIIVSVVITIGVSLLQIAQLELSLLSNRILDILFAYLFIQPIGVGMIAYFIEEIHKNYQLRKRIVKFKRLEAIDQMGAAISHEIRNPLTASIGFVQLLQSETISKESNVEFLSILKNELKSVETIIQNYLNYSKKDVESVETLTVHKELQKVIQVLRPSAKKNSIEIITSFSIMDKIEGDRQKFHQCFINIIKNAIEAMPNGGILRVETELTATNVIIRVKDNGNGMTSEQLSKLGQLYYSTKGDQGTGLGIPVVYNIIQSMNGRIHVESEVGVGTTFVFTFSSSAHILDYNF